MNPAPAPRGISTPETWSTTMSLFDLGLPELMDALRSSLMWRPDGKRYNAGFLSPHDSTAMEISSEAISELHSLRPSIDSPHRVKITLQTISFTSQKKQD